MASEALAPTRPFSYLLSDVHLMASEPATVTAWRTFIREHAFHAEALYLLGDLFEVWIGDDGMGDFEHSVLEDLAQLKQRGVKLYMMVGNRDFLIGQRFCEQAGIQILTDPSVVVRYDQRVLLSHGDALCIHDKPYQRLRKVVRHPLFQFIIRHLPLKTRQALANKARMGSQQHTQQQRVEYMDVDTDLCVQWLNQHNTTTLIHGHTHKPDVHTLTNGLTRVTLGDWHPNGVLARWDQSGICLLKTPKLEAWR